MNATVAAPIRLSTAPRKTAGLLAALALAGVPFLAGDHALYVAISGGVMAAAAVPLTVLTGSAGLPSLGTAAFLAMGAFSSGILAMQFGIGLLPAALVACLMGLVVGVLVAILTLRVSGLYLAVGTLALQHVVNIAATSIDLKLTYAAGFQLEDPSLLGFALDTRARWWGFVIVLLAAIYWVFRYLQASRVGREWSFLRAQPAAASALGVSVVATRLKVFALTSAVIAFVGAVDGYRIGSVQASTYTMQLAIVYLTISALGGAGNLAGAIAAAYAITLLPSAVFGVMQALSVDATSRAAGVENIVIGLVLIAALLRLPQRLAAALTARSGAHAGS